MSENYQLFPGKNLSNLFEDIYTNQVQKKVKISALIEELKSHVKSSNDIAVLAPIINDMIGQSVRNDEHLIKLATIAQRLIVAQHKTEGDDGYLTETEKQQLLDELESTKQSVVDINDDLDLNVDDINGTSKTKVEASTPTADD